MKNSIIISIIIASMCLLASCGDDSSSPTGPTNEAPQSFTVSSIAQNNSIVLNWTLAEDPDGDPIVYSVFLEGQEVITAIADTFATLDQLEYGTTYSGSVIASDENGAASEATFEATTGVKAIQSDFEDSNENWGTFADARGDSVIYHTNGGNPGGYISIIDLTTGEYFYFSAPDKFKGDLRDFKSGTLSYDLLISRSSSSADLRDIIIQNSNNGTEISYVFDEKPTTEWSPFSVALEPSENWINEEGIAATDQEFDAVLQNVTKLFIRGEYTTGKDEASLDNVILQATGY